MATPESWPSLSSVSLLGQFGTTDRSEPGRVLGFLTPVSRAVRIVGRCAICREHSICSTVHASSVRQCKVAQNAIMSTEVMLLDSAACRALADKMRADGKAAKRTKTQAAIHQQKQNG